MPDPPAEQGLGFREWDNGKENGNYYSILGLYWVIWRPSNVVPFWVWYRFLVRALIRTTKKVLHWRV